MKVILVLISFLCFNVYAREELVLNSESTYNPTYQNRFSYLKDGSFLVTNEMINVTQRTFM